MYKRVILISLLISSTVYGIAQHDNLKSNAIFIEFGGTAGHYSLNYERIIYLSNTLGFSVGIGFSPSLINFESSPRFSPRLPIQLKFFHKVKKHTFEIGTALLLYRWYNHSSSLAANIKNTDLALFGQIGYKYSILRERFFVGIAITPNFYDNGSYVWQPWGALRFGYKF